MSAPLRIGTRGSRLALWQANHVAAALQPLAAPRQVVLVEIVTAGDQVRDVPLPQLGGEGVFTKEIQAALLDGRVDVAVHSLKDLPTIAVPGLALAAVPPRGPTGDVLVSRRLPKFERLPPGAVLATSSLRRRAQILHHRPDLRLINIRGNVETRLRKLDTEDLDGLILAEAGLKRLGLGDQITHRLDPVWMLPAVGQGALGLECRANDAVTLGLVRGLDDAASHQAVTAERAFLRSLGGGCQVPIGAAATVTADTLSLRGVVLDAEGKRRIDDAVAGRAEDADELGHELARRLCACGAAELLP
jgi:hydroxymethylbilane synthase